MNPHREPITNGPMLYSTTHIKVKRKIVKLLASDALRLSSPRIALAHGCLFPACPNAGMENWSRFRRLPIIYGILTIFCRPFRFFSCPDNCSPSTAKPSRITPIAPRRYIAICAFAAPLALRHANCRFTSPSIVCYIAGTDLANLPYRFTGAPRRTSRFNRRMSEDEDATNSES